MMLVVASTCIWQLFMVGVWPFLHNDITGDADGYVESRFTIQGIGLAIHNYAAANNGQLPPAVVRDRAGKPLYSWRVAILPYFGEDSGVPGDFHMDETWDSDHNKKLLSRCPVYVSPWASEQDKVAGLTVYQAIVGPETAFERPGLTWKDFPNGTSKSILVVEAAERVPWSKPVDVTYDPDGALPRLGGRFTRRIYRFGLIVGRKSGFVACMGDGSARFIPETIDEATLRQWISRKGGPEDPDSVLEKLRRPDPSR
jgi:hypothetical protein